ncbi:MAG: hypothetical protein U7127_05145 [Phormidium sp.]
MPIQFKEEIIADTWNADKFRSALVSRLIAIGFAQVGGSGNDLIFSVKAPNSSTTKAEANLRVLVEQSSGTNIKTQIWQGDGVNGNTLLNPTSVMSDPHNTTNNISYGANESFTVKFVSLSSPEVKAVLWQRSDNQYGLGNAGFIFPSKKSQWWPETSLFAFASANSDLNGLRCLPGNSYGPGHADFSFFPEGFPNNVNFGGTRDLIKRIIICKDGGVAAETSPDIGVLAAGGMGQLAQHEINGEVWVNVRNARSIAFRIA